MKLLGVIIVVFILSTLNLFMLDLLLGFSFKDAIFHLVNPFWVMNVSEYLMIIGVFLLVIGQQVFFMLQKRKEDNN